MQYQIFLSGVSSEFESARDALADGFQGKGLRVAVQRSFRQGDHPSTLLKKLHDYIRDCDAVVFLIGTHSGSYPPETSEFLPKEMLPEGIERASYTQWEYYFARYYNKKLHVYFADAS